MAPAPKFAACAGRIVLAASSPTAGPLLRLILRHIDCEPAQLSLVSSDAEAGREAAELGVRFEPHAVTRDELVPLFDRRLQGGDLFINDEATLGTLDALSLCQDRAVLYCDGRLSSWSHAFDTPAVSLDGRSAYAMRNSVLARRDASREGPTAVFGHGGNPGLVSHFAKLALIKMASDAGSQEQEPATRADWATLGASLGVRAIHFTEVDEQTTTEGRAPNEFVDTAAPGALASSSVMAPELGWGTHERHWPIEGRDFGYGCGAAIRMARTGLSTSIRSWTPALGSVSGVLLSRASATSMADLLTVRESGRTTYRPTCHAVVRPCDDAWISLRQFRELHYRAPARLRTAASEQIEGRVELGVLLMGHSRGSYWFGCRLEAREARSLSARASPGALLSSASLMAAAAWTLNHPDRGIHEPEDLPHERILEMCAPYLGEVAGTYSDWTPLAGRGHPFPEELDEADPWQFKNFRMAG
ncbi:MAG: saccharopine dehydrogenase NADP-binding domain-containing protein [Betaproteobacteria bacterium]|nr:saccharopine dehydrogenase NADP-binding domain-containing protein [Betaproteobacteria bacterium]